jgi:hypothetical protein
LEETFVTKLRAFQYALALASSLLTVAASANTIISTPVRGGRSSAGFSATNLTSHGGPVITSAKVVFIFWGPSFSNAASPDFLYAQTLQNFRNQLGTTPEYNVITQYSGIQLSNLGAGTADWFDASTPPTSVTDTAVQAKVNSYLASHSFDASAIYEVVIPSTSYSDDGSGNNSCGGPNLAYCAYHSWIGSGASAIKYSIQPYPSCSGCQAVGWSDVQNQQHFVLHETRETVTDPVGTGWWGTGLNDEADDKCNWTPAPFFGTGGYGYQYEWSNASSSCVQSTPIPPPNPSGNPFVYVSAADQRQACYGIATHTSSYCDSISDFNDRQMCYGLAQGSQTPCTQITDRNLQLACYGIAVKPNFPSNCRDITDSNLRQFCYGASGVAFNDISQCDSITSRDTQLLCYAMNDFVNSNCRDISTTDDRQFCYGVSGHDSAQCASIQ